MVEQLKSLETAAPISIAEAPILSVRDLRVAFDTPSGRLIAVDGVSFDLSRGRTTGMVGESGSGKSLSALALLGLVPPPGRIIGGTAMFGQRDLLTMDRISLQDVRGNRIAMVFQEPTTALNPVYTIGNQIAEVFQIHRKMSRREAADRAVHALVAVGIPDPKLRADAYPHELSGGMRQRAMIAMALACEPDVLIADEATTALDTTVQSQILELMLELQDKMGMAILFISHNLGVVSEIADDVVVLYAGRVAETAGNESFFAEPLHPYSRGMIATLPTPEQRGQILPTIPGMVPDLRNWSGGCRFASRCPLADDECRTSEPEPKLYPGGRAAACHKAGMPG